MEITKPAQILQTESGLYNVPLKMSFMEEVYPERDNAYLRALDVFYLVARFEREKDKDVCMWTKRELLPMLAEVTGLQTRSKGVPFAVLKKYVLFCVQNKVPGAKDAMLRISDPGMEKIKRQMVASPFHLQRIMDIMFDDVKANTVDITYRCYLWLAFAGVAEEDAVGITKKNVSLNDMTINIQDRVYPLYRESLEAFRKAIRLTAFAYSHAGYRDTILRDRIESECILRGIRTGYAPRDGELIARKRTFNSMLVKKNAELSAATGNELSYKRVFLSGVFYRMLEMDTAGLAPKPTGDMKSKYEQFTRIRENALQKDYRRWKETFYK